MSDGRFADRLVVETELPFRGGLLPLSVVYPFDYPDVAPTIFGRSVLPRHQQPASGNFCVLEDSDRDWRPWWPAAKLVDENLRWLLEDSERGADAVTAGEADMPEPATAHFVYSARAVIVVPDPFWVQRPPTAGGTMTICGTAPSLFLKKAGHFGEADGSVARHFDREGEERGHWTALPEPPSPTLADDELIDAIEAADPKAFVRLERQLRKSKGAPGVEGWLGLTFSEEGPGRGEWRRAWVFLRVEVDHEGARDVGEKVRAQALTKSERARRTPELVGLDNARVLLVGAGALGSPTALELAKAGVGHLDIVDLDVFDVNNSVRHVLPPIRAGERKADAVAGYAAALNPFVAIEGHNLTIGGWEPESDRLHALVAAADIVADTTGSQSVARILQRHCTEEKTPLVVAGFSRGSHGGEIAIVRPGGACLMCLELAQRDEDVPTPPEGPGGNVRPVGCSHPAATGAGFDITELATSTTRAVVGVSGACSYPSTEWDWAIVAFRDDPRWQTGALSRHAECPYHP